MFCLAGWDIPPTGQEGADLEGFVGGVSTPREEKHPFPTGLVSTENKEQDRLSRDWAWPERGRGHVPPTTKGPDRVGQPEEAGARGPLPSGRVSLHSGVESTPWGVGLPGSPARCLAESRTPRHARSPGLRRKLSQNSQEAPGSLGTWPACRRILGVVLDLSGFRQVGVEDGDD